MKDFHPVGGGIAARPTDIAFPSLTRIRQVLADHRPVTAPVSGRKRAAVAMLLHQRPTGPEMLFIERASDPRDPWSGNLAFPGGRIDPQDADARAAAERETREEIGFDLSAAEYLGRLDDIRGAYLPVQIACFVYLLPQLQPPTLNEEVETLFWFPCRELLNPERHGEFSLLWGDRPRSVRGIDLLGPGRPILWGITYRLVVQFLVLIGCLGTECLQVIDD
ncbi:8-oxo-dGTP pyrophosphatase MutT (NUDIX family) [Geothermobacter ehrlichii]|uniref:8-oxo-dGTP pyrophosphatase MutT (NUDIX family) n=1 Tax=Geothermobacter ehrlichii TaxID=213224 RepID=A0A5D3WHJ7_9BACT|nr:CoA pyrophosphatase [Geothermobacter ehrlichii]TYO98266.1 8-oxo-dGTP pyrophosphatase MutT (NUDIX family) [Geothermobacter ehrlichii]